MKTTAFHRLSTGEVEHVAPSPLEVISELGTLIEPGQQITGKTYLDVNKGFYSKLRQFELRKVTPKLVTLVIEQGLANLRPSFLSEIKEYDKNPNNNRLHLLGQMMSYPPYIGSYVFIDGSLVSAHVGRPRTTAERDERVSEHTHLAYDVESFNVNDLQALNAMVDDVFHPDTKITVSDTLTSGPFGTGKPID